MAKIIIKDGKPHRMRRGKLVEIPNQWLGNITTKQTIRKRPSKLTEKSRKRLKFDNTKYEPEIDWGSLSGDEVW